MKKQPAHQPYRVHQYHYSVSEADGISHQMFFIQSALKEIGISGNIFGSKLLNVSPPKAFLWDKQKVWDCDLLLIHHSQGNPELAHISAIEIPKALVYHTIPAAKFYRHDPVMADLIQLGFRQLNRLRQEVSAAFATSKFNAEELVRHHYSQPRLLPLFSLKEELQEKRSQESGCKKSDPKTLLFVGRLTPHKNQAALIKMFYYLKTRLPKGSKLFLVGGQDSAYAEYLQLLIQQLDLSAEVQLTGSVTRERLEELYALADIFVCLSLHEGFCIPLIEAMSRHVPVVYFPRAAIGETMLQSGISLHTEDPKQVAEIISAVLESPQAIKTMVKAQAERLKTLSEEQTPARLQEAILELLATLAVSGSSSHPSVKKSSRVRRKDPVKPIKAPNRSWDPQPF